MQSTKYESNDDGDGDDCNDYQDDAMQSISTHVLYYTSVRVFVASFLIHVFPLYSCNNPAGMEYFIRYPNYNVLFAQLREREQETQREKKICILYLYAYLCEVDSFVKGKLKVYFFSLFCR